MGLCLEDAMGRITCAICCEKVGHHAGEQDYDDAFVPGAFAPTGSHAHFKLADRVSSGFLVV